MGAAWLNVGSLILGIIALSIPIINIMSSLVMNKFSKSKNLTFIFIVSIGCAAVSICLQVFYENHLVNIGDYSAMQDVAYSVARISMMLVAITIILNAIVYALHCLKKKAA